MNYQVAVIYTNMYYSNIFWNVTIESIHAPMTTEANPNAVLFINNSYTNSKILPGTWIKSCRSYTIEHKEKQLEDHHNITLQQSDAKL